MKMTAEQYLAHYGTPRHSGRYPWGSGGNTTPALGRSMSLLDQIDHLKQQGLSDTDVARGLGMTTTQYRAQRSIAQNEIKAARISQAQRLKDKGMSNGAIAKQMGLTGESSVRALLEPGAKDKTDVLTTTANFLQGHVDEKGFIDVGAGVENRVNVPRNTLNNAIQVLKEKGYVVETVQIDQGSSGNKTYVKVLAPPGTTYRDIVTQKDKIQIIDGWSEDRGHSMLGISLPPLSVSAKRIAVRYKEEGGDNADGMIYIRPGAKDLDMGGSRYAQVRIQVEGTHFLKGMAVYKDDLPDGIDIEFNTKKSSTGNKLDAMKPLKEDPDNPFGSTVRQIYKKDEFGIPKKELGLDSAVNLVNEQGDWEKWSKNLSTQMLSKQSPTLAQTQLDMTYESRKNQLDQIRSLTNPAVKKKLLQDYAEDVDAAAVHLKAAHLPRQSNHVIVPVHSLKETEVYSPRHRNGETVVLIRYPHGGTFEIPELKVNNRHKDSQKLLGKDPQDVIGIHPEVAKRLSGADFDGDTVLVIPQRDGTRIKTSSPLKSLQGFDPQRTYPGYEGMHRMTPEEKGLKMGDVSNLITDMTIKGAPHDELARAVRHSMVVIDAEKHGLNYKQSYQDNAIADLKRKYQGAANAGASTLISSRKSPLRVPERKRWQFSNRSVDPETGEKIHIPTKAPSFVNKKGKVIDPTTRTTKLAEAKDAHALSSGTKIEKVYADHSNRLKALANTARKEALEVQTTPYSKSAREAFSSEVATLNAKLNIALKNAPLERQARILANSTVAAKRQANHDMDKEEVKKLEARAIAEARTRIGAKKTLVDITQDEWNAIQAGAITNHKLTQILNNSDIDTVKALALPKTPRLMTSAKSSRARSMLASGYTQAEVADALGVSLTTLKDSIK